MTKFVFALFVGLLIIQHIEAKTPNTLFSVESHSPESCIEKHISEYIKHRLPFFIKDAEEIDEPKIIKVQNIALEHWDYNVELKYKKEILDELRVQNSLGGDDVDLNNTTSLLNGLLKINMVRLNNGQYKCSNDCDTSDDAYCYELLDSKSGETMDCSATTFIM